MLHRSVSNEKEANRKNQNENQPEGMGQAHEAIASAKRGFASARALASILRQSGSAYSPHLAGGKVRFFLLGRFKRGPISLLLFFPFSLDLKSEQKI
jgi:hypothetical protein